VVDKANPFIVPNEKSDRKHSFMLMIARAIFFKHTSRLLNRLGVFEATHLCVPAAPFLPVYLVAVDNLISMPL
jgi:hypothetical protein